MRVKFIAILAAAGVLAGAPAIAATKSAKSFAPGQQEMRKAGGDPGASSYAPGHLKKKYHAKSAKSFAPGQKK